MVHKISSYGRSNWENGSKGDKKGQFYGLITNIFSYHVSARALKSFQTILMGVGGGGYSHSTYLNDSLQLLYPI
jgi:hypothetical protein